MKNLILLCVGLLWVSPAFADDAWQTTKGQDFIIYSRADIPDDFVQTTMNTSEDELSAVEENFGMVSPPSWTGDKRILIYIYSDENDYVKSGGQAAWSHGAAFAKAKTIKTYPEVGGFFDTILPHELGHIVFRADIGFDAVVPLWFEEGVAIYQEKAKRLGSDKIVQEAIEKGQFIPLTRLTGMRLYKDTDNKIVDLFYTESASVVYYMITELGEQSFYMFCEELKNGTSFDDALHKIYLRYSNVDELNQGWIDYLQG